MTRPTPSPESTRAALHCAEQLWETTRGLTDAFKIDRQRPDYPSLPAWSDLSPPSAAGVRADVHRRRWRSPHGRAHRRESAGLVTVHALKPTQPLVSYQANADVVDPIDAERTAGVRRALDHIVAGHRGRGLYELRRSLTRQARLAGIVDDPTPAPCPCGGRCRP